MLYQIGSFISSPFQLLICSYPVLMVNKLCVEIHIFVLVEPQIYPYISRFARVCYPPLWHLQISFLIELHVLLLHQSYPSFLDSQRSFCSISVFSSFINHLKYRPLSPSFPNFTIFHQYFLIVLICYKSFAARSLAAAIL